MTFYIMAVVSIIVCLIVARLELLLTRSRRTESRLRDQLFVLRLEADDREREYVHNMSITKPKFGGRLAKYKWD